MTVGRLLADILQVYLLILIARLILDWVFVLNRSFRPHGAGAVAVDAVFVMTDPPLKALRKVLPPLRIGRVAVDLGFLVLLIGLQILIGVVAGL